MTDAGQTSYGGKRVMEERYKQTLGTKQPPVAQVTSNTGPVVARLQTTRWSAERDHVGQRFREGSLDLRLPDASVVVIRSDKWAPGHTGIQDVSFNLRDSSGNILLHFNPRGWSKSIVLNSLRNGVGWGPEEIIRNLEAFDLHSPNTIAFVNSSDTFEIFVNKKFLYKYRKRYIGEVAKIDYRWRGQNSFLSDPLTMTVHDSISRHLT